jgi:hypothetical protein
MDSFRLLSDEQNGILDRANLSEMPKQIYNRCGIHITALLTGEGYTLVVTYCVNNWSIADFQSGGYAIECGSSMRRKFESVSRNI